MRHILGLAGQVQVLVLVQRAAERHQDRAGLERIARAAVHLLGPDIARRFPGKRQFEADLVSALPGPLQGKIRTRLAAACRLAVDFDGNGIIRPARNPDLEREGLRFAAKGQAHILPIGHIGFHADVDRTGVALPAEFGRGEQVDIQRVLAERIDILRQGPEQLGADTAAAMDEALVVFLFLVQVGEIEDVLVAVLVGDADVVDRCLDLGDIGFGLGFEPVEALVKQQPERGAAQLVVVALVG